MRAKPDMKPWGSTNKSKMSSLGSGTNSASIGHLLWGCAAPTGLKKCVSIPNPGLAPWAIQECRPYRAHLRSHHQSIYFIILMSLAQ